MLICVITKIQPAQNKSSVYVQLKSDLNFLKDTPWNFGQLIPFTTQKRKEILEIPLERITNFCSVNGYKHDKCDIYTIPVNPASK